VTGQVRFDYYDLFALSVATDFVNTRSETNGTDELLTAADLERFLRGYSDMSTLTDEGQRGALDIDRIAALYAGALAPLATSSEELEELRDVRLLLRQVFELSRAEPGSAIRTLNGALSNYRAVPRISTQHDDPHLHFEAAEDGIVHWLAVTMLMGLVVFICDGNSARLGICASTTCRRAFIDRSKNSKKKYCSDACAHRESVAAYRARGRQVLLGS
jgi:Putative stress-induced transcription regulator/CGNR zinc finger